MAYVTGISGNVISAASAAYAPTNSSDVSAIASAYQVVSSVGDDGTFITSINGSALSGAGGGITGDYVEKSAINVAVGSSVLAESTGFAQGVRATGRSLGFAWGDNVSANFYAVAFGSLCRAYNGYAFGQGLSAKNYVTAFGTYNNYTANSAFVIGDGTGPLKRHDLMVITYDGEITMYSGTADTVGTGIMSSIRAISAAATGGSFDSATCSAIASSYAESAVSSKADSSALSSYALSADVSGTVDLVTSQSANWSTNADWEQTATSSPAYIENKPDLVDIVAGPGIAIDNPDGNTLRVSVAQDVETVLWDNPNGQSTGQLSLSESPLNFEYVAVYAQAKNPTGADGFNNGNFGQFYNRMLSKTLKNQNGFVDYAHMDGNNTTSGFTWYSLTTKWSGASTTTWTWARTELNGNSVNDWYYMLRIVGINRIANN